jgi:hypothetical protein
MAILSEYRTVATAVISAGGSGFVKGLLVMRMTRVAAGAAAAGLIVAGCGQGAATTIALAEGKGGGAELFAAMAEAQQEAGSYRFEMTMDVEGTEISGSGEASVGSDPTDQAMSMTVSVPGGMGDVETRVVGTTIYMSTGMFGMPGDDRWLVLDPEGDDPFSQMLGDMSDMLAGADLQAQFSEYSDMMEVEEVGSDTVDGTDVTEYAVTTDVEAALEMMGMSDQMPEDVELDEVTYSLFVDDDALTRLVRSDLGGLGTMEMRFFDYGEDVTVEEPPADKQTDFITFFEELTGQELSEEDLAELAEMMDGGN